MAEAEQIKDGEAGEPERARRLPRAFEGPLGKLLKQCRGSFYFVGALTCVTEVLALAPIVFILNLFDRVIPSRSGVTLLSLLLAVVVVYMFWAALDWVRNQLMIRISLRIDWELASSVFDAAFRRYLLQRQINVHKVLDDLLKLRQFLTGEPILALMAAPFTVIFALVAGLFHIYLAIFIVASMLILVGAAYLTKELASPVLKAAGDANAEANRLAAQSLRNAESALALGMQTSIRRQWNERHRAFLELQMNATEASGVLGGLTSFLGRLLPSLTFALAIWLAINGEITSGMVIAGAFLLRRALAPMQMVLRRWDDIAAARIAYHNLNAMLESEEARAERMTLPAPRGQLRVRELTVKPPRAKEPALHEVTLSLEPGEVLAVLGPSASGKSTLARALVGLWPPHSGSVRLDGAEIAEWIHGDLGQYVGYVPQDIEFFEGTVAQNIARLGEVDAEKVVAATRAVGLHGMVLSFPKGYDTRLGEQRHPLTGGQKQRLAIARALYGNPCYVVMDEPDASLDEAGQRALLRAIRTARRAGATVVFTTHRAELLEAADRVIILNEGRIEWQGTPAELKARTSASADGRVARLAGDG